MKWRNAENILKIEIYKLIKSFKFLAKRFYFLKYYNKFAIQNIYSKNFSLE